MPKQRGTLASIRGDPFDPARWLAARTPVVIVTAGATAVGFASAPTDGVPLGSPKCAEAIVYVTPAHRRHGAARAAMRELLSVARVMGLWKMVAYALQDDVAVRTLLDRLDFREVGVLAKHVQLQTGWSDVVLLERLVLSARKSMPSITDT
ncbi:MAG: GNAT family N-acetyltransferase [Polyangiaceae bacterium]